MAGNQVPPQEIQLELWPPDLAEARGPARACAINRNASRLTGESNLHKAIARTKLDRPVHVRFNQNTSVILSLGKGPNQSLVLRAHESFRLAPASVAIAIVRLYLTTIRKDTHRRLSHLVSCWHHEAAMPPDGPEPGELKSGVHNDLRACLDSVNRQWFDGQLMLDIGYASKASQRLMGKHQRRRPKSLILINPILDHQWITSWYLHFLVFHECLHELIPPRASGGRLLVHPPEFRAREKLHPDFGRARGYEEWITGAAWKELLNAHRRRAGDQ
jgi:hypothetical protein